MILVAGGDSFTFGNELKDQSPNIYSQSTYAALLAKENNLEYYCAAWPANANNAITRMTMTACENYKKRGHKLIALVTWTFTNRYEFRFNYHTGHKLSPWYTISAWSVINNINIIEREFKKYDETIWEKQKENLRIGQITGTSNFAKSWFKNVGDSEYYELFSSLKEILFLQNYFETNGISYLFIPADNHFYDHPNYDRQKDEYLSTLYDQIKWNNWFFFDRGTHFNETQEKRGFYQWALENKYPMGVSHPLEEAHAAAAELIKEKFNELVKKSLE